MLLEFLIVILFVIGIKWLMTKRNPVFMEWDEYQKKVDFLDEFHFQQNCRLQSIRNSELLKSSKDLYTKTFRIGMEGKKTRWIGV